MVPTNNPVRSGCLFYSRFSTSTFKLFFFFLIVFILGFREAPFQPK